MALKQTKVHKYFVVSTKSSIFARLINTKCQTKEKQL